MIRIIFLGPPGSGKGTQSSLIAKKYNIVKISTGEILRKSFLCKQSTKIDSHNTEKIISSGNLVDDKLITKLMLDRINYKDCRNGFILDGFPRTINQAISIKKSNIFINFVIEFCVSDFEIIDRISGRLIHINSGRTYHIKHNPPRYYGLDDITGEKLSIRKDDDIKTLQQRLEQYHQHTMPVSEFYKKESKKNNILYFCINGNRNILEIYKELVKILNLYMY